MMILDVVVTVLSVNGGCIELTKVYSIESTLHVYRYGFDLYRNNLCRNDFVSKQP